MSRINQRDPISVKVTYTDINELPVEESFRSLHKASEALSINIGILKGLLRGKTTRSSKSVPKNLTVVQIPTLPKAPKPPKSSKPQKSPKISEKYYCVVCDKYIQPRSKYDHVKTKSHLKNEETAEKKQPEPHIS
jgi:hypothetical protein